MYNWLSEVVEDKGEQMVGKLGKVYMFGIVDKNDKEFPITLDFEDGKGNFYIGDPREPEKWNVPEKGEKLKIACKITMSEKDFHGLLDQTLDIRKAIFSRRLKISGGIGGIKEANRLVNEFLKPYMIDTWAEAQR